MTRKGKILVVEDTDEWRDIFGETLELEGYTVRTTSSYDQAKKTLDQQAFDVAVVDIRLSESDDKNTDGMDVLRYITEAKDVTSLMIVSGRGTVGLTREAFAEHGVLDFIEKDRFKEKDFVEIVEKGVQKARIAGRQVKAPFQTLRETGLSLQEASLLPGSDQDRYHLLKAMFIELLPLAPPSVIPVASRLVEVPGKEAPGKRHVAQILGWSRGIGAAFAARLGAVQVMKQESQNHTRYIKDLPLGDRTTTRVGDPFYKSNLGGLVYALNGAPFEQMCDLASYYKDKDSSQITSVVENLYRSTCATLYNSKGTEEIQVDLSDAYRKVTDQLVALREEERKIEEADLQQMEEEDAKDYLASREKQRPAVDPIDFAQERQFTFSNLVGIAHGDLCDGNVIVDSQARTWLVGFFSTGTSDVLLADMETPDSAAFRAHQAGKRSLLHDFVTLEASIRETLVDAETGALEEFDVALSSPKAFGEPVSIKSPLSIPELDKALTAITKIRELAGEIAPSAAGMQAYYAELLFQLLSLYARLPDCPRKDMLFRSAAVLAERLEKEWPQA